MRVTVVTGRPALPARIIQQHLAALGEIPWEAVSGRYDGATTAAIARVQRRWALPVHGIADRATADALLTAARLVAPASP